MNRIADRTTPLAELQAVFRNHWQTEGFLTPEHEELRLRQGLKALKAFHAHEEARPDPPTYVERRFSLTMDSIRLVGIFDRIDCTSVPCGAGGVIIDYKTSDVADEGEATKRTKASRQLALYALAYQKLFGEFPNAIELRFLTPDLIVGRAKPTEKMLAKAVEEMEHAAAGIRAGVFRAEPTYQACRYCAYAPICPERRAA